ncbi:hypothetical protein SAY87_008005 [Trapa incisa]|uniref:Uncharacterized protein n=1 Tax=Trapa incisa TaxID=236973 RepID=A0AAN7KCI5_9MYRT|nr:hypothetical protein SAY87_008005 [Trapa incisa]
MAKIVNGGSPRRRAEEADYVGVRRQRRERGDLVGELLVTFSVGGEGDPLDGDRPAAAAGACEGSSVDASMAASSDKVEGRKAICCSDQLAVVKYLHHLLLSLSVSAVS